MAVRKYGVIRPSRFSWLPIWDWNKARLMEAITRAGISLPTHCRSRARIGGRFAMRFSNAAFSFDAPSTISVEHPYQVRAPIA
jgi:hypothetical protein